MTTAPVPAKTSANVPRNSAAYFFIDRCSQDAASNDKSTHPGKLWSIVVFANRLSQVAGCACRALVLFLFAPANEAGAYHDQHYARPAEGSHFFMAEKLRGGGCEHKAERSKWP